jgi:type I restriction enzyme S subunit
MIELLKEKRSALITQAVTKGLDTKVKLKPSGVQWIGDIPEGWEVRRWRYIAICNPTKGEANISEDIEVQFVPMELVPDEGYLLDLSETRKAHEVYKGYTYFINGDVLIAKITPCFENGKGAIAENLKNGIGFGTTELHVYRAHQDKMNSKYLFMISKLKAFRSLGEASMKGAAGQKRVTDLFIKDSIIPLPPLHEQSAIVEFLDKEMSKIDTLIRKIENQIELLNKYKQSLITHAVTGKIDVRGELNA